MELHAAYGSIRLTSMENSISESIVLTTTSNVFGGIFLLAPKNSHYNQGQIKGKIIRFETQMYANNSNKMA
jgi:hypothetical protein